MKLTYDKELDALYIHFKKGTYDHSKKVSDAVMVDFSKKNAVLGVEVLDASRNIGSIPTEKTLSVAVSPSKVKPSAIAK